MLYLTLLLEIGRLRVGRLLVSLLLLQRRLGDSDVIVGGDAEWVSIDQFNRRLRYTHDERAILLVVSRLDVVERLREKLW